MFAPIFAVCSADAGVSALLGAAGDCRLYLFGEAPEGVAKPYAVWQSIGGDPQSYLGSRPDIDRFELQIDVYGRSASEARAVATALRNAVELKANIVRWSGESKDVPTKTYRYSFDVDWWVNR